MAFIPPERSIHSDGHWRIFTNDEDRKGVAHCFSQESAELLVDALNARRAVPVEPPGDTTRLDWLADQAAIVAGSVDMADACGLSVLPVGKKDGSTGFQRIGHGWTNLELARTLREAIDAAMCSSTPEVMSTEAPTEKAQAALAEAEGLIAEIHALSVPKRGPHSAEWVNKRAEAGMLDGEAGLDASVGGGGVEGFSKGNKMSWAPGPPAPPVRNSRDVGGRDCG